MVETMSRESDIGKDTYSIGGKSALFSANPLFSISSTKEVK